jgi:ATP-binding cassette subfamily B protein
MLGVHERLRVVLIESCFGLSTGLVIGLGTVLVLMIGVQSVRSGEMTIGNVLLVIAYVGQLYAPLETIGRQIAEQQGSLVSAARSFQLLNSAPAILDSGNTELLRARGAVEFSNVSFAYPSASYVFEDLSFSVPAGAAVGISGPTGSGKTTLLNLMMRFYDPLRGHILLDGLDLRDYVLSDLRSQFSIVLQEPVLFSSTIAENIAYGRPEASTDEVIAAAKAAAAHDFICALPQGYETMVGDRGARLSGGERQRITIARAFLRDSPILILDEPTSSVDRDTEDAIMNAMRRLMAGRTTFMIAHRLTTLDVCDIRLHLTGGRLHAAQPTTIAMSGATDQRKDSGRGEPVAT